MNRVRFIVMLAVVLVSASPAPKAATGTYDDIVAKFFDQIAEGKAEAAIDALYKTNPYSDKITDAIVNMKSSLTSQTALMGTYRGSSLIIRKELGDRLAYLYYIVSYDRQPLKVEFFFYKPGEKWVLQSMNYSDKVLDDIRDFARFDLSEKLH